MILRTCLLVVSVLLIQSAHAVNFKYKADKEEQSTVDNGFYDLTFSSGDQLIGRKNPVGIKLKLKDNKKFKKSKRSPNEEKPRAKLSGNPNGWTANIATRDEEGGDITIMLFPPPSGAGFKSDTVIQFDAERFPGKKADRKSKTKKKEKAELIIFDPITAMTVHRSEVEI